MYFLLRDWYRHNMFGDGWISILRPIYSHSCSTLRSINPPIENAIGIFPFKLKVIPGWLRRIPPYRLREEQWKLDHENQGCR
jgi:hypothetical protein